MPGLDFPVRIIKNMPGKSWLDMLETLQMMDAVYSR